MPACYFMRLGRQGSFVQDAVERGYVGVDYGMVDDFTGKFSTNGPPSTRRTSPATLNSVLTRRRWPRAWHAGRSGPSARE